MSGEDGAPRFTGEISALSNINSNANGDNMTTALRRQIVKALNIGYVVKESDQKHREDSITAATVDVDKGNRLLLVAVHKPGAAPPYHVRRTGEHKVEISLEDQDGDYVDDFTAAFIEAKRTQLLDGDLSLSPAMTAQEFEGVSKKVLSGKRVRIIPKL